MILAVLPLMGSFLSRLLGSEASLHRIAGKSNQLRIPDHDLRDLSFTLGTTWMDNLHRAYLRVQLMSLFQERILDFSWIGLVLRSWEGWVEGQKNGSRSQVSIASIPQLPDIDLNQESDWWIRILKYAQQPEQRPRVLFLDVHEGLNLTAEPNQETIRQAQAIKREIVSLREQGIPAYIALITDQTRDEPFIKTFGVADVSIGAFGQSDWTADQILNETSKRLSEPIFIIRTNDNDYWKSVLSRVTLISLLDFGKRVVLSGKSLPLNAWEGVTMHPNGNQIILEAVEDTVGFEATIQEVQSVELSQ